MQMSEWGDYRTVQCKARKEVGLSEVERVMCAGDAEEFKKAIQGD
jgi:hypothetical protein